jgi:hypothetical protein
MAWTLAKRLDHPPSAPGQHVPSSAPGNEADDRTVSGAFAGRPVDES